MKIKAILFGSIGTLVETSDIQRQSFNDAFELTGLDWNWDENEYRKLLKRSGGANRIKEYGDNKKITIDGKKIRDLKTKIFNEYLNKNSLDPREGVIDVIKFSKKNGLKLGFVSSTTKNNINSIFNTLKKSINKKVFDFIGNNEMVLREKPFPDIYDYSLNFLKVEPNECFAIEDTEESLKSAIAAKIKCIAFPGKYHTESKFKGSFKIVNKLSTELFN
tara:strand:- start:390 stop:1046 length:657 start_codon:yes stop_codon:yes gene_type:complete